MKLFHWASPAGNFGDDLNLFLWDRYLPNAFNTDDDTLFVGVGTVLGNDLPRASRTVVFGSGTGYRTPPQIDSSWDFHAVRGPLTQRALGLSSEMSVSDPAILLATWDELWPAKTNDVVFVPHWTGAKDPLWLAACKRAGIEFIDPTADAKSVIKRLAAAKLVITESMHGAIIADAFRTPFIAISATHEAAFKWHDWSCSLLMEYNPFRISRHSGVDALRRRTPVFDPLALAPYGERVDRDYAAFMNRDFTKPRAAPVRLSPLRRAADKALFIASVDAVARQLRDLAMYPGTMSVDLALESMQKILLERLDSLAERLSRSQSSTH